MVGRRPLIFNFDPRLSKAEIDQRRTQWAVLLTAVAVGLALLVAGVGIYVNGIRQPGLAVAIVNGHGIRRDAWQHYESLIQAELQAKQAFIQQQPAPANDPAAGAQQQAELNALQQQLSSASDQAVTDLINGAVVAAAVPKLEQQGAPAAQIVPSSKQLDDALTQERQGLGITSDSQFQNFLHAIGMNETDLRAALSMRLQEDQVRTYLSRDVKPVQQQVKARIMSYGNAGKAADALKALQGGQPWENVNLQYAKDQAAQETSRAVAWTPKGLESATFDQFAFSAQPLQISDLLTDNGTHVIIQVEDVGPARPLSQSQIDQIKAKTYTDWLNQQTQAAQIQRYPQNMS